jgi:hypothetical protein
MRTPQQRRSIALWTCVLWLLGAEVLPALHQAGHDDHHTHAADGSILARELEQHFAAHEAGLAHHHHPVKREPRRPRRPHSEQTALDHAGSGHAATGIAHHAAAVQRPARPVLSPLPIAPPTWRVVYERHDQLARTIAARPNARGPPAHG